MARLDLYFKKLKKYIHEKKEKGTNVSELSYIKPLPFSEIEKEKKDTVILKGDTGVELGAPDQESASIVLWTEITLL